jgi:hypothetical protein
MRTYAASDYAVSAGKRRLDLPRSCGNGPKGRFVFIGLEDDVSCGLIDILRVKQAL